MQSRRHRVLYVQRPRGGGSATGLYELVRGLDTGRIEPIVLCYERNVYCESFAELGAKVLVLNDGPPADRKGPKGLRGSLSRLAQHSRAIKQINRLIRHDWPVARMIAELIRSEEVDLVHNNDNPRGDRASMIAARLAGVPQVSHVRFFPDYFRPIDRRLAEFVDFFVYVSTAIEEHYRAEVGVPAYKGQVIYDSLDIAAFGGGEGGGARVRDELGLDAEDQLITNVGRLVPWKGQDIFCQAMARVAASNPRVKALIVGAHPPNRAGEEYFRSLQGIVEQLGLRGRVIFSGFRRDVPDILAASDIVVHSASMPEPFGRIIVEAMAAGRPVVATAAGGVLEILEHQKTGLLVPLESAERMADAIETLLRDPEHAARMGDAAQQDVATRFAPERFSRAIQQVYERALASRAPA